MRIFLLKIRKKSKIISIKNLDRFKLKQNEILLLFGGDEMLSKYKYENLSKEDKIKIDSNPNLANKNEFKIARALLFEFEKNYKFAQTIHQSISHSANHAILAISLDKVGIDLEAIKNRDFYPHLDFCFSDDEKYKVQNSPNPLNEFYKIWTYKEASLKFFNLGFYALDTMQENTTRHFSDILYNRESKFIYSVAY